MTSFRKARRSLRWGLGLTIPRARFWKISLYSLLLITCLSLLVISKNIFADTNVNGAIETDTTWTAANSPYIVTGDVIVWPDVNLTIQAGVTIKFNDGTNLIVDGTLNVNGTPENPILFTSNSPTPSYGSWGSIKFRGSTASVVQHAKVEYGSDGLFFQAPSNYPDMPFYISNSTISNNLRGVFLGIGRVNFTSCAIKQNSGDGLHSENGRINILNCTISNNGEFGISKEENQMLIQESTISSNGKSGIRGMVIHSGGRLTIIKSNISYNSEHGITRPRGIEILDSIISHNSIHGIYFFRGDIAWARACVISHNTECGLYYDIDSDGGVVTYSTITENQIGIYIGEVDRPPNIENNNIFNNLQYDIKNNLLYPAEITGINNWWGTTVVSEIQDNIYDYYDDYNLGIVVFQPFLTSYMPMPELLIELNIQVVNASDSSPKELQAYITTPFNDPPYNPNGYTSSTGWMQLTWEFGENGLWTGRHNYTFGEDCYGMANRYCNIYYNTRVMIEDEGKTVIGLTFLGSGNYSFAVHSNSTVTNLKYNSSKALLSFTTKGETGTTGYASITIPKIATSSIDDVTVYKDDVPVEFTYSEDDNYYFLLITYDQSSHQFEVELGTSYTLEISVSPPDAGTTDPPVGEYPCWQGSMIPVTLALSEGFEFRYWDLSGVNVGTNNPYTVTMDSSHTLTAICYNNVNIPLPSSNLASNPMGRVFFIFNNLKYYITNEEAFNSYGFDWSNVKPWSEMNPDGYQSSHIDYDYLLDGNMPLPDRDYIAGNVNDGSLYWVPYYTWDGEKYPITWEGYNAYSGYLLSLPIRYGDPATSLPTSSTILDGVNPIPDPTVPSYVIANNPLGRHFFIFNNYKYYFTTPEAYFSYGFDWDDIDPTVNPDDYPSAQVSFNYLLEDSSSIFRKSLPNQPYIVGDINDGSLYWIPYYTFDGMKYAITDMDAFDSYGFNEDMIRFGDPGILLPTSSYILDGMNEIPEIVNQ